MIAATISSLQQVEGLSVEWLGFDTYDILPFELPPYSIVRQEYDVKEQKLWVMNMGRLNTEQQAQQLMLEMIDYYRLEAGCTLKLINHKPVELELYNPMSGDSFMLGIDSTQSHAFCVN